MTAHLLMMNCDKNAKGGKAVCSFCCPVCSLPLTESDRTYACANAHSFDKAKNGYVNLLTHASRPAGNHGDNRDMVRARRDFLDKGFYAPLQQKIAALAKVFAPGRCAVRQRLRRRVLYRCGS